MRAAYYDHLGPAKDVLLIKDIPRPTPAHGEVLVQMVCSGVNPSDVKSRAGGRAELQFPLVIPHSDGAGIIAAVGPGVGARRLGERVWLWNAQWRRPFGTAAAYVALPSEQAVPLPETIPFEVGACLGVPWLTAWRAVNYRPLSSAYQTMLIAGGAGSVGFYAIQLAKRAGFRVATTISSGQKAKLALSAGADVAIDYTREDTAAAIASFTDNRGVDQVIEVDLNSNASSYTKLLRHDGLVVAYGSSDWSAALPLREWLVHGVELAVFIVYELASEMRDRAIRDSDRMLRDPSFKHLIDASFSLDRIVEAHEAVESGRSLGNILVNLT